MFKVAVKRQFSAAHSLPGHKGKCARLHGHSWSVEAVLSSEELDSGGMAIDFDDAARMLQKVIDPYDHRHLNELDQFAGVSPTAENVARLVFDGMLELLEASGSAAVLRSVTVWESPDSWASYGA
jgi:6-pyruvoyltetrahydropterin/6-carboxytetrahydropterin synthase